MSKAKLVIYAVMIIILLAISLGVMTWKKNADKKVFVRLQGIARKYSAYSLFVGETSNFRVTVTSKKHIIEDHDWFECSIDSIASNRAHISSIQVRLSTRKAPLYSEYHTTFEGDRPVWMQDFTFKIEITPDCYDKSIPLTVKIGITKLGYELEPVGGKGHYYDTGVTWSEEVVLSIPIFNPVKGAEINKELAVPLSVLKNTNRITVILLLCIIALMIATMIPIIKWQEEGCRNQTILGLLFLFSLTIIYVKLLKMAGIYSPKSDLTEVGKFLFTLIPSSITFFILLTIFYKRPKKETG